MNQQTAPPAIVRSAVNLEALAAEINAAHEAGEKSTRAGLEHFRAAGEALLKAKKECAHGKWLKWLKENVKFSQQTASCYMRLAADWDKLPAAGNLRGALRILAGKAVDAGAQAPNSPASPGGQESTPSESSAPAVESGPSDDSEGEAAAEATIGSCPEPSADDEAKIPERLKQYFEHVEKFKRVARLAAPLANLAQEIEQTPAYRKAVEGKKHKEPSTYIRTAARVIESMTPKRPCPECGSAEYEPSPDSEPCTACGGKGYQTADEVAP
jgi:hypothetical protein